MREAFDDLAKAFASGMSRRDALRRFGLATAGAMFAFGPAKAVAATTAHRFDCDAFCGFMFKPNSQAYFSCIRDAKHGTGACFDLGPASKDCRGVDCPKHSICISNNVNFNHTITPGDAFCMPVHF
jgi:hypothetical protein